MNSGQMVDEIKHGEIAETEYGVFVKKLGNGSIYYCDKEGNTKFGMGSNGQVLLNGYFLSQKWKIKD